LLAKRQGSYQVAALVLLLTSWQKTLLMQLISALRPAAGLPGN
jgi:hypothetical protein